MFREFSGLGPDIVYATLTIVGWGVDALISWNSVRACREEMHRSRVGRSSSFNCCSAHLVFLVFGSDDPPIWSTARLTSQIFPIGTDWPAVGDLLRQTPPFLRSARDISPADPFGTSTVGCGSCHRLSGRWYILRARQGEVGPGGVSHSGSIPGSGVNACPRNRCKPRCAESDRGRINIGNS